MSRVSDWWSDHSRGVRILAAYMWIIGVLLAAAGLYLDYRGWWRDWPFATNMVSSLTAACVGIPLALLVMQQVVTRSTREFDRSRALRISRSEVGSFLVSLEFCLSFLPLDMDSFVHRIESDTNFIDRTCRGHEGSILELSNADPSILYICESLRLTLQEFRPSRGVADEIRRLLLNWQSIGRTAARHAGIADEVWAAPEGATLEGALLAASRIDYHLLGVQPSVRVFRPKPTPTWPTGSPLPVLRTSLRALRTIEHLPGGDAADIAVTVQKSVRSLRDLRKASSALGTSVQLLARRDRSRKASDS